jgi:hypothetical protein
VWSDTDLGPIEPIDTRHSFLCLVEGRGRGGSTKANSEGEREKLLDIITAAIYDCSNLSLNFKFEFQIFPRFRAHITLARSSLLVIVCLLVNTPKLASVAVFLSFPLFSPSFFVLL